MSRTLQVQDPVQLFSWECRKRLVNCTFEQYIPCHLHAVCSCDHLIPQEEGAESDDTRELRAIAGRTLCRAAWQGIHRARGLCHLRPLGDRGYPRSASSCSRVDHAGTLSTLMLP